MSRRVGSVAVAAWLAYSSWVCALVLPHHVDNTQAWVSELGAPSQPFHDLYRWGDRIAGVLLVLLGLMVWRLGRSALWRAVAVLHVLGGAFLEVEAFNPLPCAPSLDPVCRERLLGGTPSGAEVFHAIASFVGTASLVLAFVISWWTLRERQGPRWYALGVVIAAAGIGEAMSGQSVLPHTGTVQRVALSCMAIAGSWSLTWLVQTHGTRRTSGP